MPFLALFLKRSMVNFVPMLRFHIIALLLLAPLLAFSPEKPIEVSWQTLAKVTFEKKYLPDEELTQWVPTFGPEVTALEGMRIQISGYVVPVDLDANYFVLSSNPFASCFFCGGAGPETVMDLRLRKNGRRFKTDEYLTFSGILRLNAHDIYELNYILEDALLED